ncbi:MAG: nucleotidyltransferase domain-containing protein [Planctomycetes bacterium]|nr:nucleotidyltransferase domain-containing protein [Planctomycetota bacterium]
MRKSTLDALLPKTRQGILAQALIRAPQRGMYLSDLARRLRVPGSSLQRELAALVAADILVRRIDGNRVYFAPNPACPFLPELRGLLIKTVGLADVLRSALGPLNKYITISFVYGSIARGEERSESDIDLMIVGDVTIKQIANPLHVAEDVLERPVSATVLSPDEFRKKAKDNHFVRTVLQGTRIFIIGDEHELAETLN